jgi:hypothetical protein
VNRAAYVAVDTPLVLIGNIAVYQTLDDRLVPVASMTSHSGVQYLRATAEPNGTVTVTVLHRTVQ